MISIEEYRALPIAWGADGDVNWAVYRAVSGDVGRAMNGAGNWAVNGAVNRDLYRDLYGTVFGTVFRAFEGGFDDADS